MTVIKTILFVILILIAIAFFLPNGYDSGKDWVVNKVSGLTSEGVGNTLNSIVDITNYKCSSNQSCVDHFQIKGLKCSSSEECYVEVK